MGKTADLVLKGTYYYAGLEEYRMGRLKAGAPDFEQCLLETRRDPLRRARDAVYCLRLSGIDS